MKGGKRKSLSRRNFLGTVGAATAAFTIVPRSVLGGPGYVQPSDILNVAGVGVGGRGASDIRGISDPDVVVASPSRQSNNVAQNPSRQSNAEPRALRPPVKLANIYALCDVDEVRAANTFKGYPKAKIYSDWRQMLEKERSSIDAVVIGCADHSHAPVAAAFIREKKHVYVEKPMCKTIFECRTLAELAKLYDVVTQMGNQAHAAAGSRQCVEWIQGGVIGLVREVHMWTNRPTGGGWVQGNLKRPEGVPVPSTLNYDVWLGPAPEKPYSPEIIPGKWRGLWDYGTGAMGDMGAHIMDVPIWALNLGMPARIQASSSPYSTDYLPAAEWVIYEFPARGYMPPVSLTWVDGGLRPPLPDGLEPGRKLATNNMGYTTYYGDKGIMTHASHGAAPELIPADKNFKGPDPWLPRTGNIYEDWIGAIKNGTKSCNDFSISSKLTEVMLLTNIAVLNQKTDIKLEYDSVNMKITNLLEANNLFHYEYRKGWSL